MAKEKSAFLDNLGRIYAMYTVVFIVFVIALAVAEQIGRAHV